MYIGGYILKKLSVQGLLSLSPLEIYNIKNYDIQVF